MLDKIKSKIVEMYKSGFCIRRVGCSGVADLIKELKADKGYYESWKANIAMAYKDNEYWYRQKTGKKTLNKQDKHIIANNAADYFLQLLCK